MKVTGVQLGRVAPPHSGHEMIMREMLARHGKDSLVMVGSSNVFNARTPFTFEQRRSLIRKIFPDIQIIGLPDIDRSRLLHSESTIPLWLEQIKAIQDGMNARFKFYGGSEEDLRFFPGTFDSEVLVDRHTAGQNISATAVRELLRQRNRAALKDVMNELIIDEAIELFHQNMKILEVT